MDIVDKLKDVHALSASMGGECNHLVEAINEIEKLRKQTNKNKDNKDNKDKEEEYTYREFEMLGLLENLGGALCLAETIKADKGEIPAYAYLHKQVNSIVSDAGKLVRQIFGLCPNCNSAPATYPHTCPYKEEINGDDKELCTCCDGCAAQCAYDI